MNVREWKPIAERIGRLWPPAMDGAIAEEYFAILEPFSRQDVAQALTMIAKRADQRFRPHTGLVFEAAEALQRARQEALPPADTDPLTAEQHAEVLAEQRQRRAIEDADLADIISRTASQAVKDAAEARRAALAECRRRHEAVIDLLHGPHLRAPLAELPRLMTPSRCAAKEFDERLARLRGAEVPA